MAFPPGGCYRRFRGREYRLLDFARHSELRGWAAIHRALCGEGGSWARKPALRSEPAE